MKICIDMRPALSRSTGVGIYLQTLVSALSDIDPSNEYHLFSSSWKERYEPPSLGPNFRIHDCNWPVAVLNYTWHRWSVPSIEFFVGTSLDVVHSPGPLLVPSKNAHRITTVHDLYFLKQPDQTVREIKRDYAALAREHCRKSDAVIAISEHTRSQLIELLDVPSSRIYTIRHGADHFFAESVPAEELTAIYAKFGIRTPFLLYVGSREPRKNVTSLVEAFAKRAKDSQLVLAGPPAPEPLLLPGIIETGYVSREELRALYNGATALVMPSLEEGFGLPLLEAMLAGTPVVASDIPAFREVANDAFYSFDPNKVEDLQEAIGRILQDSELRQRLTRLGTERAKRFSWADAARKTLELYQNL